MTTTLQQAMLKAGLVSKERLAKEESKKKRAEFESRRKAVPPQRPGKKSGRPTRPSAPARREEKKSVGFIEGKHHHHIRTECEACRKSLPDVEYYDHPNKSLESQWLCVKCADFHNIDDRYRQTMQSQHAQSRLFRREYGATKVFK